KAWVDGAEVTGTLATQSLSDTNDTVAAGVYSATTLSAVDADLASGNIKSGVTIFGKAGDSNVVNTSSGDATAPEILAGKKAWVDGAEVTGSMADKDGDNASTGQSATGGVNKLVAPTGFYDGDDTVTATDAQIAALDADITAANIKKDTVIFGVTGTLEAAAYPAPVAATGQTTCYKTSDNSEDAGCADTSATGQDGKVKAGKTASPRFTINMQSDGTTPDGTVTDNLTGLIWLKNANCANGYKTWADALTFANTLADGSTAHNGGDCDLADGSTAGQWRLPNIRELHSLLNFAYSSPALSNAAGTAKWTESDPFTSVQTGNYWSSTANAGNTNNAWNLNLYYGYVDTFSKTFNFYVWPVRGGQ
ncbi:MAG: DUF1566 domain-containing protein, partial [Thiolinea sp.]